MELIGAVQRSGDTIATYFHRGVPECVSFDSIKEKCQKCTDAEIKKERVLCVATEGVDGKPVAVAYLNGTVLSLFSVDEYRREYLRVYAKEVMQYYDCGRAESEDR